MAVVPCEPSQFPVCDLAAPAGRALPASCHAQLDDQGFVALRNYVTPEAIRRLSAEVLDLRAGMAPGFYSTEAQNIFLEPDEDAHAGGPLRKAQVSSSKLLFAADELSEASALTALYTWRPLLEFVAAALRVEHHRQLPEVRHAGLVLLH